MAAMIRHIAMLTLRADTADAAIDRLVSELRALPGLIDEIATYEVGVDLRLVAGNSTVAIVADFDDADAWTVYRNHPAHVRVLDEIIAPLLDTRTAIQFER